MFFLEWAVFTHICVLGSTSPTPLNLWLCSASCVFLHFLSYFSVFPLRISPSPEWPYWPICYDLGLVVSTRISSSIIWNQPQWFEPSLGGGTSSDVAPLLRKQQKRGSPGLVFPPPLNTAEVTPGEVYDSMRTWEWQFRDETRIRSCFLNREKTRL